MTEKVTRVFGGSNKATAAWNMYHCHRKTDEVVGNIVCESRELPGDFGKKQVSERVMIMHLVLDHD